MSPSPSRQCAIAIVLLVAAGIAAVQSFSSTPSLTTHQRSVTQLHTDFSFDGFLWGDDASSSSSSSANSGNDSTSSGSNSGSNSGSSGRKKSSRFATGKDLQNLRTDIKNLRENLQWAIALQDELRIQDLTKAIQDGENMDPERVYVKTMKRLSDYAEKKKNNKGTTRPSGSKDDEEEQAMVAKWNKEAQEARACIPRFNLEGLWVGNYGKQGYEMINVTYTGDTLIATKVTGDRFVPRNEMTFRANLAPQPSSLSEGTAAASPSSTPSSQDHSALPPIQLTPESAEKWGISELDRYSGEGQVAKQEFKDPNMVEGQLIVFGESHFSFVWIPNRHHVFFGRPTPEVTLRMLRDIYAQEDELDRMKRHLERCYDMDMTDSLAREAARREKQKQDSGDDDDEMDEWPFFRRIKLENELKELEERRKKEEAKRSKKSTLEPKSDLISNFWNVRKWGSYIDNVLNDEQKKKRKDG